MSFAFLNIKIYITIVFNSHPPKKKKKKKYIYILHGLNNVSFLWKFTDDKKEYEYLGH